MTNSAENTLNETKTDTPITEKTPANVQEKTAPENDAQVHQNNVKKDSVETAEKTVEAEQKRLFSDFDLAPELQKALDILGFESPTNVQEKTLEAALKGTDLMVSAKTGSGKTLAFLLPSIAHVLENTPAKQEGALPSVLVVCPTRELVEQVTQDAIKLVKFCKGMRVGTIMGGMPYGKQLAGIKGAKIVIATPGRLLDLAKRGNIDLTAVTHMVLDEADRMLDLGFKEDLASISKLCNNRGQTLMFSATFADDIVGLAKSLMNKPERISLSSTQDKHVDITQSLYYADNNNHKNKLLLHWLETESINQAVIFVPTQVECDSLTEQLRESGQNVISLHGGMRQFMRMKRLKLLRDGRVKILIATDVAARGLDVPNISHVINYGLPMRHEDYVHRIGRTGRAGRKGTAITVTTHRERGRVRQLEQFIKQQLSVLEVEGLEPTAPPPRKGRNDGGNGNSRNRNNRKDGGRNFSRSGGGRTSSNNRDGGRTSSNNRDGARSYDNRSSNSDRGEKRFSDKPRSEFKSNNRSSEKSSSDVDGNSKTYRAKPDFKRGKKPSFDKSAKKPFYKDENRAARTYNDPEKKKEGVTVIKKRKPKQFKSED